MRRLTLPSLFLTLLLSSCARQPPAYSSDAPGFLSGILHGATVLGSFLASLFFDCRIYAFPNSGVWYDFGFLIGLPISLAWLAVLLNSELRAIFGAPVLLIAVGLIFNPLTILIGVLVWRAFFKSY